MKLTTRLASSLVLACGLLAASACVVVAKPRPGAVARDGWARLGERWVEGKADHDAIHVGRADGRFTRIMLVADHSALELFDVVVTFGDGQTWSPGTRLIFGPDTTSRVIDLPGGARVIRRVDFRYGNLPGGGRARMELWAR